ncbi:uncharacterized protein LOC118773421 [Megalops cyprinoides]|uniref:uncharacterized protein LOC118773421 n=1 Tax=Megalops cyprinoides TaxID=118141 RepID=UPI00186521D4|nr:uncharacterized protein LOC118773421 [Megalops cyprinoides]
MSRFPNLPLTPIMSCFWIALVMTSGFSRAAISYWSNKPWINVNSSEISEGEWVRVLCGVPIDYTGGFCRLYNDQRTTPLMSLQTHTYTCQFLVSSRHLLGRRSAGARTSVRCDYTLQDYESVSSDDEVVVVWGIVEKPVLTVSPLVVMMNDSVQLNCSVPGQQAASCSVYRDGFAINGLPCNHAIMMGKQLMIWQSTSLLNEIDVTCEYNVEGLDYVRSKTSNPATIVIVDPGRIELSTNHTHGTFVCDVPSRIHDFVRLQTGNESIKLEQGGILRLQAINTNTEPFNHTCRHV